MQFHPEEELSSGEVNWKGVLNTPGFNYPGLPGESDKGESKKSFAISEAFLLQSGEAPALPATPRRGSGYR